jgi:hypothetical protein
MLGFKVSMDMARCLYMSIVYPHTNILPSVTDVRLRDVDGVDVYETEIGGKMRTQVAAFGKKEGRVRRCAVHASALANIDGDLAEKVNGFASSRYADLAMVVKTIELSAEEVKSPLDINLAAWSELDNLRRVVDLSINFVSLAFPIVSMWWFLYGDDSTQMCFMLSDMGRPMAPRDLDNAHIFEVLYSVLVLNEHVGMIHGDLTTDNMCLKSHNHSHIMFDTGAEKYRFRMGARLGIVDLSDAARFCSPQFVESVATMYETYFPDFYSTNTMKIIDALMEREVDTIHRAAAFDLYIFADAALKVKSCAEVDKVRRIKKMSADILLDLFSGERCDWAAREIMLDLYDPIKNAEQTVDMVYRCGQKMNWSASSWDTLPPIFKATKLMKGDEVEVVDSIAPRLVRAHFQLREREGRRLRT